MPQQDYYTRTLYLKTPNGRIEAGTSEATAMDLGSSSGNILSIYGKTTTTSGSTRNIYSALYMNGTSGYCDSVRGRTIVGAAAGGGISGVHGGVECGTSGTVTGLGIGVRGTFMGKNAAHAGGSVFGGMSELWAEGTITDFGGYANHAIHRFVIDGNATGKNTVDYALDFAVTASGCGVYTNGVTNTNMLASLTEALKCKINGLTVFLPFATAIT
jgi:hypothetical protein